ncbi:MAG: 3-phosphoglycerate dehydrogenase [Gammaproteobacteria bacterium]|nr:3-phosphoglycerate dehydrogenase [Gammaproteobacteria bacterium]
MSDIVITEFMDATAIAEVLKGREVLYDPALVDRVDQLHAALTDCRALIVRNRTQVRGALLDAAPLLKVVGRLGVGLDNIDLDACASRGIAVRAANGANDLAVAEYVITAALMLLRRAWFATDRVAAGSWPRMDLIGRELAGRRLGLVGFGAIARLTAAKGAALGMSIAAFDPFVPSGHPAWTGVERSTLAALLASSDVISLHTPLTPQTHRMIDGNALGRVKPGAILINAARGGILDEAALVTALKDGRLGGAALDVFETEPVSAAAGALFREVPNLLLTPHIAGVTEESNVRVSAVIAKTVLDVLDA